MTDTNTGKKPEMKVHTPRRWGLDGDKVLEKLQGKMVLVRLHDGSSLVGQLAGYTEYNVTLRCADGVKLINKGFMVTLEPAKGQNGATTVSG